MTANLQSKVGKHQQFLCLSPHCSAPSSRVFSSKQSSLHACCSRWVVAETSILEMGQVDFDPLLPLQFQTAPLQTQAYLHNNRTVITAYLSQLVDTLRCCLLSQVDSFAEAVRGLREKLFAFNFPKLQQIAELTKEGKSVRSQQLSEACGKGLPLRPNSCLPTFRHIKNLIKLVEFQLNAIIHHSQNPTLDEADEVSPEDSAPSELIGGSAVGKQIECNLRKSESCKSAMVEQQQLPTTVSWRQGEQLSLQQIVELTSQSRVEGLCLVDTSTAFFFQRLYDVPPRHLIVELPFHTPPQTNYPVLSKAHPDQIQLVLGYLSHALAVEGKNVLICCPEDRGSLLKAFCWDHHIKNMKVTIGIGKKAAKKQLCKMNMRHQKKVC